MNDETLKPCPFCGGVAEITYHNGGWPDGCYSARCKDWKCPGKTSSGSQAVATEAWNTRADTDALTAAQEENERLVHDIERLSASLSAEVTENERLREALQAIYHGDDSPDGMQGDIARAALDGLPIS